MTPPRRPALYPTTPGSHVTRRSRNILSNDVQHHARKGDECTLCPVRRSAQSARVWAYARRATEGGKPATHARRPSAPACRARTGARRGRARWTGAPRAAWSMAAEAGTKTTLSSGAVPSGATRIRAARWTATTARTQKAAHDHHRHPTHRRRRHHHPRRPSRRHHHAHRPRSGSRAWNRGVARIKRTHASGSAASVAAFMATRHA